MAEPCVESKSRLESHLHTLAGADIEVFQGGGGRPLLFLHGAGGFDPDAPFVERLCQQFRLIAPRHPGFGRSVLLDWMSTADDFAYLYLELLDKLDIKDVVVVGSSIGGWIAAEMATKSTIRMAALVLVSPVGIKVGPRDRLDIPDIFAMEQAKLERLLYHEPEKWRFDPSSKTDEDLMAIARGRETLALIAWEPYMHDPKLKHRLHRIDRPTLLLRGESDGLVSRSYAEAYAALIPGARLEHIARAGHAPQIERPDVFAESIGRFVAQRAE